MSKKPSKPETRIEDYLDVMTGGNAVLPQPILRIEFYYAFLAGMTVELPEPILDDEKLLAKICGMAVEAPTYIPGISPRLYAYMAKKGGQDVQVPDPILRLECYWYDYSAGEAPSVQEYTGAVPVTFIADGTPLLDYLISGNTVQSGKPTPDNPIMPEGTGERTGNLFDATTSINGIISDNGDVISNFAYSTSDYIRIDAEFTISLLSIYTPSARIIRCGYYTGSKQHIANADSVSFRDGYKALQFSPPNGTAFIRFSFISREGYADTHIMLNSGSTALPYEPYGYKIPISSASTTTPVYLGEVETTRRIRKLVLDGTESEDVLRMPVVNLFYYKVQNGLPLNSGGCRCTHYINNQVPNVQLNNDEVKLDVTNVWGSTANVIVFKDTSKATLEDFKTWLQQQYASGTPVTVWYTLGTSETSVVNEPLMKIGDYADSISMEQAGVSIPTANGSTTLDVETTVKPSEIYIKYRGEAVATLSMLSAEVSSPEETTEEKNPEEMEEEENER